MVICLIYEHFEKKIRSVIISQNHYLNQILDIHPLCGAWHHFFLTDDLTVFLLVFCCWFLASPTAGLQ